MPMPRMTDAYVLAGGRDPAKFWRLQVKDGIYAAELRRRPGRCTSRQIHAEYVCTRRTWG